MRGLLVLILLSGVVAAQTPSSDSSSPSKTPPSKQPSSSQSKTAESPKLVPPRSDRVDASSLDEDPGDSSSKDTQIDITAPPNDAKEHPQSSDMLMDGGSSASGDTMELRPWNPHKAAKDIEVGDYYFKRRNYVAAESRYREALLYKENDAEATYKLGVCLEKLNRNDEAVEQYANYLKILPEGPESLTAKKAIDHLKSSAANAKPAQ